MKKWIREGKNRNLCMWYCSREEVWVSFLWEKIICQLNNKKMDLDRERWVWVACAQKDVIIWACNEENKQRPREVKVHFMLRKGQPSQRGWGSGRWWEGNLEAYRVWSVEQDYSEMMWQCIPWSRRHCLKQKPLIRVLSHCCDLGYWL